MKRNYLLLFLCSLLCSSASAQTFSDSLTGNPISTTGWTYAVGTSFVNGQQFTLTPNLGNETGWIYYDSAANLSACAQFTIDFQFRIQGAPGYNMTADGIAVWYITTPPTAFGTQGANIGVPQYANGLIMIMDTWDNDGNMNNPLITMLHYTGTTQFYTEGSSTGVLTNTITNTPATLTSQSFVDDGSWHECKLTYNFGVINLYYDGSTTPVITANQVLTQTGYFGFSASTGGTTSLQSIKNVHITGFTTPPAPTAPSPVELCHNIPADSLMVTSGTDLTWFDMAGDTLTGAPTPSTTNIDTVYYAVTQGIGVCASPPDTIQVIVNPIPTPPVILGDTAYCINAPQVPFTSTGQNLLWYTADTGGVGDTLQPVIPTGTPGNYVYYVNQTVNGCMSPRDSVIVDVHPPTPPPAVTPVTLCQYDVDTPITYAATGEGLLWYTNPPSGPGSSVAPTPPTGTPGSTTYYVSQTIEGCQGDSTPVAVTVIHKPTLSFNIADTQICLFSHDVITYTGNATSSGTYNWTLPPGDTAISGAGTNTLTAAFNTPGMAQVGFNVTDSGCKSDDTTLAIDVVQSPAPIFDFMPDVCINLPDLISYTDPVGDSSDLYYWTFTGASSVTGSGAGPYNVVWDNSGVYSVSLSVVVSSCSSDTTVSIISVHPSPDVHIAPPSSTDICIGDSLQFQASTDTVAVYGYQWMPTADFPVNSMSQVYGILDTPGYISVRAISNFGCVNTDSVLINTHPCCDVFVPNAFTPTAAVNNLFRIVGPRPQKITDFRVFDRWGNVIYNATDDKGWDGTYNGTAQNMDTYYYTISYICADGKQYQKKGDVTLIR